MAPFADCLVVARDVGWLPAARRALDAFGKDVAVATRGFLEYALGLSSTLAGRTEGIAALRGAVEAGCSSGSRKLEMQATVKSHLIHVFIKLDIRTRAELAAAATQRRISHLVSKGGRTS